MGVIVVGVDHAAGAKAASRFALEEARLRIIRGTDKNGHEGMS